MRQLAARGRGLAAASVLAFGLGACSQEVPHIPAFSALTSLAAIGGGADLRPEDFAGRPALVNFWATWCEPCRAEMEDLQRLSDGMQDIAVVGVSLDADVRLAQEFLLQRRVRFPNYSLPPDKGRARGVRISALPETWLVAEDGRVLSQVTGARDWSAAAEQARLRRELGRVPSPQTEK